MNSNDWIAEHVMGFRRGDCWSANSTSSSLPDGTFETWFACDRCGQVIYNGKTKPCAQYPFPKFTLVDLMRKLGEKGDYVMVRYDALRTEHNFTVSLNLARVADIDDPLQALCDYLYSNRDRLFPEMQKEAVFDFGPATFTFEPWLTRDAMPMFFANIRDAIKLLQKVVGQVEGK